MVSAQVTIMIAATPSHPPRKASVGSVDDIADTILRYVASRPNACDSIDGICEWWIPQQRYVMAKEQVLAALELLETKGQIETRTGADGSVLYRAC
jgi:hypothetical protein